MYIKPVSECKMVLKYSFKPFFLQCIFEFMINTASQGSNSVNGREKYFNCINVKKQTVQWSHGPVVRGITFCTGVSWGAGSNPGRSTSSCCFFLSSYKFYSVACFCLFSLHDPF